MGSIYLSAPPKPHCQNSDSARPDQIRDPVSAPPLNCTNPNMVPEKGGLQTSQKGGKRGLFGQTQVGRLRDTRKKLFTTQVQIHTQRLQYTKTF